MAKSKSKTRGKPVAVVPEDELANTNEVDLLAKYSREQVVDSLCVYLGYPACGAFESLFETATALEGAGWDLGIEPRERVAWATRYVEANRGVPDAVPWWDVATRHWLLSWAQRAPDEVRSFRDELGKPLDKLADFCLAVTRTSAMPDDVATAIAKHYLNSPPNGYAYAELIPASEVATYAERALAAEPFPILRRERVFEVAEAAGPQLRLGLAVNYCASDFRRVGVSLLSADSVSITRRDVETWAERVRAPEGRIVLSLVYARLAGQGLASLPEWAEQALLLDLRSGSLEDIDVTREALLALPNDLARNLLAQALREERATLLIPALADEGVLYEFLARVEAGDVSRDTAVEALGHCGGEGLSALLSFPGCKKPVSKVSASLATVVAEALGRLLPRFGSASNRQGAAAVLAPWLGHGSKTVVAAVKRTIEWLGADARPQLAFALQSGKKQTRLEAERLLERLSQQQPEVSTPLDVVAERALASASTGEEFLRLCQEVFQHSETWPTAVRPVVHQHGALCLEWLRPWFEEHVPQGDVRLWCYVVDLLADDTAAVWVAVDTFARMPKLPTSLWARPRRALARLGEKLAAPAKHVLTHGRTEYAEPIHGLLAAYAGEEAVELLMLALASDSKAVRGHAVDGLSRVGLAPIEPVLALLGNENPGVRISVAELLAVWGRAEAREPLRVALRAETRAPVRAYIEEALAATGAAPLWDGGLDEGALGGDVERRLDEALEARGQGVSEPRFLLDSPLPALRYKSGRVVSERPALGFLSLVTQLDSTLKGRLVRQVSAWLDADALAAWSRHLHARWNRSKDTKFKWAVYQLWLLADETLVDEVGAGIGALRANEHVAVACYLRVLQWRASRRALDWLVHWAAALHSRGTRLLAQTLLGRVAYRSGRPVSELRAEADAWIYQRHYEQTLVNKPALVRFDTERFVGYLEDCLFTGRTWSWAEWSALHATFPDLFKRLVWRVEFFDGGAKCFDVALERRGLFQSGSGEGVEGDVVTKIGLAHPIFGSPEHWSKVRQWLGEKANEPPLPQWDRPVTRYGGSGDLDFSNLTTDSERLDRWIKRRGWFHGEALDHGLVYSNTKTLAALGLVFQLNHSGYPIGQHDFAERVQLHGLEIFDMEGRALVLAELSPQVYSELCYQLTSLCAK